MAPPPSMRCHPASRGHHAALRRSGSTGSRDRYTVSETPSGPVMMVRVALSPATSTRSTAASVTADPAPATSHRGRRTPSVSGVRSRVQYSPNAASSPASSQRPGSRTSVIATRPMPRGATRATSLPSGVLATERVANRSCSDQLATGTGRLAHVRRELRSAGPASRAAGAATKKSRSGSGPEPPSTTSSARSSRPRPLSAIAIFSAARSAELSDASVLPSVTTTSNAETAAVVRRRSGSSDRFTYSYRYASRATSDRTATSPPRSPSQVFRCRVSKLGAVSRRSTRGSRRGSTETPSVSATAAPSARAVIT